MSEVPVIDLSEWRDKRLEEGSVDIKLSDGTALRIPPPDMWPDKCLEIIRDPAKNDGDLAKVLWGAENWKKFVADGGTTATFSQLLIERFKMTSGESEASASS